MWPAQGMSDLAAPILYVMRDEAEAFWCFACLMERMEVRERLALQSSTPWMLPALWVTWGKEIFVSYPGRLDTQA